MEISVHRRVAERLPFADRTFDAALAQELGHQFPPGRLALVVENIYREGALQHEVGFYYRLDWPAGLAETDLGGGVEPGHRFRWADAEELNSLRFEPAGLVPVLQISVMPFATYSSTAAPRRKTRPITSTRVRGQRQKLASPCAPYGQDRLDRTSRYPSGSAIVTPHRSQYGLRESTRMPPASIRRLTTSSSITPSR